MIFHQEVSIVWKKKMFGQYWYYILPYIFALIFWPFCFGIVVVFGEVTNCCAHCVSRTVSLEGSCHHWNLVGPSAPWRNSSPVRRQRKTCRGTLLSLIYRRYRTPRNSFTLSMRVLVPYRFIIKTINNIAYFCILYNRIVHTHRAFNENIVQAISYDFSIHIFFFKSVKIKRVINRSIHLSLNIVCYDVFHAHLLFAF